MPAGAAVVQGGVFNVEGEMVLRDGQYVSSGDTMFRLQVGDGAGEGCIVWGIFLQYTEYVV